MDLYNLVKYATVFSFSGFSVSEIESVLRCNLISAINSVYLHIGNPLLVLCLYSKYSLKYTKKLLNSEYKSSGCL